MKVFLDTSPFAKRYVAEQRSDKVMALCLKADSLVVSVLCLPELISTLSRLLREKKLIKADYRKLNDEAIVDLTEVDLCQITVEVLASVVSLLELHPLPATDTIHTACALAVKPDVFVSADHR